MRKFLVVGLILLLTGGTLWAAPQDIRTDRVDVLLGVKIMPPGELELICGERDTLLRGCITDPDPCCSWVFLPGDRSEHVALFAVQYHATYKTLRTECGAAEPCFNDNILHTMDYSTRGPRSEYRMGQIGDLICKVFDLPIPFNQRVTFAQLFMGGLVAG